MENYIIEPQEFKTKQFAKDFNASDLKSFEYINGIIIWSCLRGGHLVDEDFDNNINYFTTRLVIPEDYIAFRNMNTFYRLDRFSLSNHKFWLMIFRLLQNPELFTFKFGADGEEYKLNEKTIKLFKPEKHI